MLWATNWPHPCPPGTPTPDDAWMLDMLYLTMQHAIGFWPAIPPACMDFERRGRAA